MARTVETAPRAAEALRQAHRRLTQPGAGPAGQALWDTLRAARRRLRTHPYLGTADPDHPGYRCLVASGYRILAVFGPGQAREQP